MFTQNRRENNFFAKPDMVITMLKHSFVEITGLIKNCFDVRKQNELNVPARCIKMLAYKRSHFAI